MVQHISTAFFVSLVVLSNAYSNSAHSFDVPTGPLSSMAVSGDGKVFIAAGTQLLKLDADSLALLENAPLNPPGAGQQTDMALSPDGSRLVACVDDRARTCLAFSGENLDLEPVVITNGKDFAGQDIAIIALRDSFYLGSERENSGNDMIHLSQYSYTSEVIRTRKYNVISVSFEDRLFYGGFARNGSVYYFVADHSSDSAIRVLRVCDCESSSDSMFTALYELKLVCNGDSSSTTAICGVTLLESFADRHEPMVIVTQCDRGNRNRVCGYLLSDIDSKLNEFYASCRDSQTDSFELVWDISSSCSRFSPHSSCDLGIPAITPDSFLSGFYLVYLQATVITAGLALQVEGVSLVYLAYSGAISVFNISKTGYFTQKVLDGAVTTHLVNSTVIALHHIDGSDSIIVATEESVFHLPLETCSERRTCAACTSAEAFPLCGWCTLEDKCSRRSQCQKGTEARRWVQSIDQCITATVTPHKFTLENTTTLWVTTSPSLPPDLAYNCLLSGSGDLLPILVPAVEEIPGSQYLCDITGTIDGFESVKEVLNFSLISEETGKPVVSSSFALTIYNCAAATRCGECIQTDGVCGWCVFGGQCSANADICPAPTGVNSNYLQLNASMSYEEVCPVLEPASTPSGHYTLPAGVERDLPLRTRNLLPPRDGFKYVCKMGSDILQASFNTSDNSLLCSAPEIKIISSAQEVISLQVMWTNGMTEYALDEASANEINCIFYDCDRLTSGCSSCISTNANGFQCGWCLTENSKCAVEEKCDDSNFSTSTGRCPAPQITSVEPARGPAEGGTLIRVTGTDLGATFTDIAGVTLQGPSSNATCRLVDSFGSEYIPGEQVFCETEAVSFPGDYHVVLRVNRNGTSQQLQASVGFTVEQPTVRGVSPSYGPKSGGVEVTVSGSNLDIGNTEDTRVQLSGADCAVTQIARTEISCTSAAFDDSESSFVNASRVGSVLVFIDNANARLSGMEFEFRDDPIYTHVHPRTVIPAGGINLTFEGINLDVAVQPTLIFTDSRVTSSERGGNCTVSQTSLTCTAPMFNTTELLANISYTVRVGNAPGPDLTNSLLTLDVQPNPVFAEDGTAIVNREHAIGEEFLLTIIGTNLGSVERSEIRVTVGGEACKDRGAEGDDMDIYVCSPPDIPPNGQKDAPIIVSIGANLHYEVGVLKYSDDSGSSGGIGFTTVIAVVTAAILLIAVSLICLVLVLCCKKAKRTGRYRFEPGGLELTHLNSSAPVPKAVEMALEELKSQLPPRLQIPSDQICLLNTIGQGEYGEVYRAHLLKCHDHLEQRTKTVAVKTFKGLYTANDVLLLMHEVIRMHEFAHPNIMSLIGVCFNPGVGIVMPFMTNGSVLSYLKKEKATLLLREAEEEVVLPVRKLLLRMCLQIAQGMEYLSQQMFVHRDLAARNCMLGHNGVVKVGDFGLAEDMYGTGYVRDACTTVKVPYKWMPPESLEEGLFSEQSDVWSYGVTCWEVFTAGRTPYPALDPPTLLRMLKEGHRLEQLDNLACLPEMYEMMRSCWKLIAPERPSFSDLVHTLELTLAAVAGYAEYCMALQTRADFETGENQYEEMHGIVWSTRNEEIGVQANSVHGMTTDGSGTGPNPVPPASVNGMETNDNCPCRASNTQLDDYISMHGAV